MDWKLEPVWITTGRFQKKKKISNLYWFYLNGFLIGKIFECMGKYHAYYVDDGKRIDLDVMGINQDDIVIAARKCDNENNH